MLTALSKMRVINYYNFKYTSTTRTTMKESFHSKIYESISTFTLTIPMVPSILPDKYKMTFFAYIPTATLKYFPQFLISSL